MLLHENYKRISDKFRRITYSTNAHLLTHRGLIMNKTIATIILTLSAGMTYAESAVDVTKVKGKSEIKVSAYLGKPTSCSKSKDEKKCQYIKGKTEVVFINGKADLVTVKGIDSDVAYSEIKTK